MRSTKVFCGKILTHTFKGDWLGFSAQTGSNHSNNPKTIPILNEVSAGVWKRVLTGVELKIPFKMVPWEWLKNGIIA